MTIFFTIGLMGFMFYPILWAMVKMVFFTLIGVFLFRPNVVRERFLPVLTRFTINILFPLYFFYHLISGWDQAVQDGWFWMVLFFLLSLLFMAVQFLLGYFATCSRSPLLKWFKKEHRKEYLLFFTMQNAGYLPLPLVTAIAPESIRIYLFFFIMAFNLIFWTISTAVIKGDEKIRFRVNPPLLGILAGIAVSVTGLHHLIPPFVYTGLNWVTVFALNLVLILLGGILSGIHPSHLSFKMEHGMFLLIRLVGYPLVIGLILLFIPAFFDDALLQKGFSITLLIEAAAPPATNLMLVLSRYGSKEQLDHSGPLMLYSYLFILISMPLFVFFGLFFSNKLIC